MTPQEQLRVLEQLDAAMRCALAWAGWANRLERLYNALAAEQMRADLAARYEEDEYAVGLAPRFHPPV